MNTKSPPPLSQARISRRTFLSAGASSAVLFTIVPRHVLGGPRQVAPSEKLNIGVVGAGGRGSDDIEGVKTENIVALCDVDQQRAASNLKRFPQAKTYQDFRVMLDKQRDLDAVVVATPDHIHAVATM